MAANRSHSGLKRQFKSEDKNSYIQNRGEANTDTQQKPELRQKKKKERSPKYLRKENPLQNLWSNMRARDVSGGRDTTEKQNNFTMNHIQLM